ncbi:hypothetical protein Pcinc_007704 [Petrolisthes cinctipes]|uniref:Uncharacterized protein n=1 Tax=Petrolisthes cinctipes TaxID=88211 RepID=A0AAE1G8W4_PETCI|nr:hypothetical protein Pcinc_007704 [Petrolisthes cinctipes]
MRCGIHYVTRRATYCLLPRLTEAKSAGTKARPARLANTIDRRSKESECGEEAWTATKRCSQCASAGCLQGRDWDLICLDTWPIC